MPELPQRLKKTYCSRPWNELHIEEDGSVTPCCVMPSNRFPMGSTLKEYIEGKPLKELKDFKKAYQEALRNAFVSVAGLNYDYSGSLTSPKPPLPPVFDKGINENIPIKSSAPLSEDSFDRRVTLSEIRNLKAPGHIFLEPPP